MNALHRRNIVGLVAMVILLAMLAGCQQPAAEAPPATYTEAGELILAEGETLCKIFDYSERVLGVEREEPVYGDVIRGEVNTGFISCPGALRGTRFVGINDILNADWEEVGIRLIPMNGISSSSISPETVAHGWGRVITMTASPRISPWTALESL